MYAPGQGNIATMQTCNDWLFKIITRRKQNLCLQKKRLSVFNSEQNIVLANIKIQYTPFEDVKSKFLYCVKIGMFMCLVYSL